MDNGQWTNGLLGFGQKIKVISEYLCHSDNVSASKVSGPEINIEFWYIQCDSLVKIVIEERLKKLS